MALKLMYLTNDPKIAKIAQDVSVDRIFLDLETRGKAERQANMDTVISHNSIDDVKKLSAVLEQDGAFGQSRFGFTTADVKKSTA